MDYTEIMDKAQKMAQAAVDTAIKDGNWSWFPCGVAGVKVRGNTDFSRWLKANSLSSPAYGGGMHVEVAPKLVGSRVQSMDLQSIFAVAFVSALATYNIKSESWSMPI